MGREAGWKRKPHRHYVSGARRKEGDEREFRISLLITVKIGLKKFHLAEKPPLTSPATKTNGG